ncbi:MAG: undecaprenyldiphospho-muramoylpentapeptide beta-N-acetylglucosaminyltransferase [Devosiaceae bacterium]|nr:undecaprenyldiphospho-muramoylpentapeptide beta-N-acetylglucosaminyltransferase [Devosiaceae bacterium MH13]
MAYFILCAGGTGGHLFPAQALSEALQSRGHTVDLMTDERADRYGVSFPARSTHIIPSATLSLRVPLKAIPSALALARGFARAATLMRSERPDAVVGFGGYPTIPPLAAARFLRIPVGLHEQNAVLGRANVAMAPSAKLIATSFPETDGLSGKTKARAVHTGNPVRAEVLNAADQPFTLPKDRQPFELLVFGGSQGARVFADLVPGALEQCDETVRQRVRVTQQCRPEDMVRVRNAYELMGVPNDLGSFFVDMPQRMARAHLVIGRSGASTVAELAAIGRPSLLVPYPHALDHDQAKNAEQLEKAGGAIVSAQKNIGPVRLAQVLTRLIDGDGAELTEMAAAARKAGRPDAVERLADEVETLGGVPGKGLDTQAEADHAAS